MQWGHLSGQAVPYGQRLAVVRHRAYYRFRLHNLADGHRDGLRGHLLEHLEPPLTHLLLTAVFIKTYDQIGSGGFKIGRRIVECQMSILADPGETDINRMLGDDRADPLAFRLRVHLAINIMEGSKR